MNTIAGAKNVDFMMTTGDNIYPNGISSPGNYAYTDRVMSSLKKKKLGTQTFDIEQDSLRENSPYKKGLAYSYLYEPDVAFYKCNALPQLFQGKEGYLTANNGFFFSDEKIENFIGRAFFAEDIQHFKPDVLKKALKKEKIKQANLLQRNFPLNSQQIQQQLGIASGGGEEFLIFTTVFLPEKELVVVKGKRVWDL